MAWRNIWRNWRRTIITVLAVVFATFLSIVMNGMQVGTYESNIRQSLDMFSGHIQIQKKEFQLNPGLNKSFIVNDSIKTALEKNPEIIGYAPRIMSNGLIGFDGNSLGALIIGMDPEKEQKVCKIADKINDGNFLSNQRIDDIVVGYKLLKTLKAAIGDTAVILATGFDGSTGNQKFVIAGTFKLGSPEIDRMGILMNLHSADELFSMYGRVNLLAISVIHFKKVDETITQLKSEISDTTLAIMNWEEFMSDMKELMDMDVVQGYIYLGLLVLLVAFGILNTVLMSITERFKEFGIMLAIGIKNSTLVYIVLIEILIISIIGIFIGNILGFAVNSYILNNPIVLTGDFAQMYEEYGFQPKLFSSLNIDIFITLSLQILVIAMITYIYPAIRILKLHPLKGIRYT